MKRLHPLLGLAVLFIVLFCSCGDKKEEVDAKALMEQKCTFCHFTDRINKEPHTPDEWRMIVERMRLSNPQMLPQEEALLITKYLQENIAKR